MKGAKWRPEMAPQPPPPTPASTNQARLRLCLLRGKKRKGKRCTSAEQKQVGIQRWKCYQWIPKPRDNLLVIVWLSGLLSRSHDVLRTRALAWPRGPLLPPCSTLKLHRRVTRNQCSANKCFSTCTLAAPSQAPPTAAPEVCQCFHRSQVCCASQASVHVSQSACGAGGHVPDRCVCVCVVLLSPHCAAAWVFLWMGDVTWQNLTVQLFLLFLWDFIFGWRRSSRHQSDGVLTIEVRSVKEKKFCSDWKKKELLILSRLNSSNVSFFIFIPIGEPYVGWICPFPFLASPTGTLEGPSAQRLDVLEEGGRGGGCRGFDGGRRLAEAKPCSDEPKGARRLVVFLSQHGEKKEKRKERV